MLPARPFLRSPAEWLTFLLSFILVAWSSRDFFMFGDDYAFLGQARRSDMSVSYLRADLFGHFSPLSRAVDFVAANGLAGDPRAEPVILLAVVAVAQLSILYLFHVAVPSRTAALGGAFLCGTSVTLVSLAHWWTAGLNILPGVAGAALSLAGAVTALSRGSIRGVILCLAGYVLAGLSWELTLLLPVYVAAFAVLIAWPGSGRPLVKQVRRTLLLWLGLGVLGVLFATNYLLSYYVSSPSAPFGDYLRGIYISLFVTVLPALVGVFATGDDNLIVAVRIVLVMLLSAGVWLTLRKGERQWRPWLFALIGWLLPSAILVASRVGVHGPWVATLPFYFLLPVMLATLGIAIALSPMVDSVAATPASRTARSNALRAIAVVIYLVIWIPSAQASGAIITTFSASIQRVPPPTGEFVANLRASAAALTRGSAPEVAVVNTDVPPGLVAAAYGPYNRLSWIAEVNGVRLDIDAYGRDQYVADANGRLRPADLVQRFSYVFAERDAPLVDYASGVSFTPQGGVCFTSTSAASSLRLTLPRQIDGSRLVLMTAVSVDRPSTRRIVGSSSLSGPLDVVNYDSKTWRPDVPGGVDSIRYSSLRLLSFDSFTPGTRVCFRSVQIAQVQ